MDEFEQEFSLDDAEAEEEDLPTNEDLDDEDEAAGGLDADEEEGF